MVPGLLLHTGIFCHIEIFGPGSLWGGPSSTRPPFPIEGGGGGGLPSIRPEPALDPPKRRAKRPRGPPRTLALNTGLSPAPIAQQYQLVARP
jgi:hypothetical protein